MKIQRNRADRVICLIMTGKIPDFFASTRAERDRLVIQALLTTGMMDSCTIA